MSLLLCAATELEIEATISFLEKDPVLKDKVEVLITGIGLTAATYQLTKKLAHTKPHMIIQAGICGSLDENLSLKDVVAVEKESIGDLGVLEAGSFKSLFNMGLVSLNKEPWHNGKLTNNLPLLQKTALPIVSGVTINEITTSEERIAFYRDQLRADIETMEGAALHYVGLCEKVPFIQVRAVSNYVGERNKSKWDLYGAIKQLNIELQRILIKLFYL